MLWWKKILGYEFFNSTELHQNEAKLQGTEKISFVPFDCRSNKEYTKVDYFVLYFLSIYEFIAALKCISK